MNSANCGREVFETAHVAQFLDVFGNTCFQSSV